MIQIKKETMVERERYIELLYTKNYAKEISTWKKQLGEVWP